MKEVVINKTTITPLYIFKVLLMFYRTSLVL